MSAPLTLGVDWPVPSWVRACVSLRGGGVSRGAYASLNLGLHVGDDPERVLENRRRLAAQLRLPAEPAWLEQAHGTDVVDLDRERLSSRRGDAVITTRSSAVCAIMTADCLPVLLTDRQGRQVGAAHAGWRGLAAGVLPAIVAAFSCRPSELIAWLGPAIGPQRFEVGDEVRASFQASGFNVNEAFVCNHHGRWLADLYALATQSLNAVGVTAIHGGGLCTHTDDQRFFSHRRSAPCGRMASLIWLEGTDGSGRSLPRGTPSE